MRTYKCLICSGLYPEDEIIFHLESAENHWDIVEQRGIYQCFEYAKGAESTEKLKSEEYGDDPLYPYCDYIKVKKRGQRGQVYVCTLHGNPLEVPDATAMVEHCFSEHRDNPETEEILRHRMKEVILHQIRVQKGSSERISPEDFERYCDEELRDQAIRNELTKELTSHAFHGYVQDKFEKLTNFVQNKISLCPLCNHDIDFMELSDQEKYIANEVKEDLKSGMQNLTEEDSKSFDKTVKRKYQGQLFEKPVDLCLKCLLHLHTAHPTALERLYAEKIVTGALPQYLVLRQYYENKKNQESLSSALGQPIKVEDRLEDWKKPFLQWLRKNH